MQFVRVVLTIVITVGVLQAATPIRFVGHTGGRVKAIIHNGNYTFIGTGETINIYDTNDPTAVKRWED